MIRTFRPGDEPAIMTVVDAALAVDRLPGITRRDVVYAVNRMAGDPEGTLVAVTPEVEWPHYALPTGLPPTGHP